MSGSLYTGFHISESFSSPSERARYTLSGFMGSLWSIIGIIVDKQMYTLFP